MCGRNVIDVTCRVLAIILMLSNIHGMAVAARSSADPCPTITSSSSNRYSEGSIGRACCSSMACCPIATLGDVFVAPDRPKIAVSVAVEQPGKSLSLQPDYPPPKLLD
ncbi:hypothetical protein CFBP6624_26225 (plasmid) [Agrobacterium tumefaciens]|uniref:Secreted protein n=1 Tax=Agrobacterium tumefaciens TaxID=358 RepID=A0AAE6ENH2_AGRTU|nr:hypothetical protein CFBP6624_26225 [Agrobacterium tumefaciens]